MTKSYRGLFIWQAAVELAADIITLTDDFPLRQRRVLVEQMQRAAVSVPSNISEGKGRLSPKELRHFLGNALFELDTQLEIARRVGLIDSNRYADLDRRLAKIGAGINRLIAHLRIP